MPTYSPAELVAVVVLATVTVVAAVWDTRFRKIPNKITVPLFLAGVVWQLVVNGWGGFANIGGGLAIGFLPLFLLWMTGSAGGGDAKLMGAVSTWLGFRNAMLVLIVSTICVLVVNIGLVAWSLVTKGPSKTKRDYLGPAARRRGPDPKTGALPRSMMTYAGPIAVAVWTVLLLMGVKNTRALNQAEKPAAEAAATETSGNVKSSSTES
jgi:prepilin peptidase CpaA